jgi:phosphohistidine swiveling domain-containing protein
MKRSPTVRTACFVVTGEMFTETARDLLLAEEPGQAYRLLADGLNGEGATDAALKILQGTHDLVGDSSVGLELVEAEDTEALRNFQKSFRYIYAGRLRHGRVWRRPVAWITHLGQKDGEWASGRVENEIGDSMSGTGAKALMRFSRERANYYCGTDEVPFALDLPDEGRVWVVFETCGELPHWMRPILSAQEALDDALAVGRRLRKISPEPAEPEEVRPVSRPSAEELRRQEEEYDRRDREREQHLRAIGEKVRAQAGDDTFQLSLKDGRVLTVPRAPFVRWSLGRTEQRDTAPPWETVSRSGEKLSMDDPNHTDWLLGAGLELSEAYSEAVNEASCDAMFKIQEDARDAARPKYAGIFAALEQLQGASHEATTLVDCGERTGIVGADIVVLPDSRGSRVKHLGNCKGVIVEKGGPLAHLVVVSRGREVTVMRHPRAREIFPEGTLVTLNPSTGRIIELDAD